MLNAATEMMITQMLRVLSNALKLDTEGMQEVIDNLPEAYQKMMALSQTMEYRILQYDAAFIAIMHKLDAIADKLNIPAQESPNVGQHTINSATDSQRSASEPVDGSAANGRSDRPNDWRGSARRLIGH